MKNKKAFTLIELVSVLVILAILALIVTPLVISIIKKVKNAADRRSVDAYGKALQLAVAGYTMDNGYSPTDLDSLEVEYTGKEVVCAVKQLKENGVLYMSQCTVNGKDVKDSKTDDGWYHYGTKNITDEEYLNMYAEALSAASLAYYEQNNSKVSDYTTLEINYTGKEVSCDVTINYDGTIYLENCTVDGNEVANYTYGNILPTYDVYSVGDEVTYNNVDYYVIKNSDETESSVTLLKSTPLTTSEVNTYGGVGTENNHVNMYVESSNTYYQQAYDDNGYGGMQFYTSETCGKINGKFVETGCTKDYELSEIKYVVDGWAQVNIPSGLEQARLITYDEVISLGYEFKPSCSTCSSGRWQKTENTPEWLYASSIYLYWTMSPSQDDVTRMWGINFDGNIGEISMTRQIGGADVRPVIVISKSVLN